MCLLIWTVFSGEQCSPWASCFHERHNTAWIPERSCLWWFNALAQVVCFPDSWFSVVCLFVPLPGINFSCSSVVCCFHLLQNHLVNFNQTWLNWGEGFKFVQIKASCFYVEVLLTFENLSVMVLFSFILFIWKIH